MRQCVHINGYVMLIFICIIVFSNRLTRRRASSWLLLLCYSDDALLKGRVRVLLDIREGDPSDCGQSEWNTAALVTAERVFYFLIFLFFSSTVAGQSNSGDRTPSYIMWSTMGRRIYSSMQPAGRSHYRKIWGFWSGHDDDDDNKRGSKVFLRARTRKFSYTLQ